MALRDTALYISAVAATTETRTVPATLGVGLAGPTRVDPSDASTQSSPVMFVWRMASVGGGAQAHCRLVVAASPATPDDDAGLVGATTDVTSTDGTFELDTSAGDDGSGPWVAIDAGGVDPSDQTRLARVAVALADDVWDWRVGLVRVAT